jgi:hypothetical protein
MRLATKFLAISLVVTGFAFPAGAQVPILETIANWQATGVTVDVFTPPGWSAADPTVMFSHGDGVSPIQYHCYRRPPVCAPAARVPDLRHAVARQMDGDDPTWASVRP